jgi:hypothetical protein
MTNSNQSSLARAQVLTLITSHESAIRASGAKSLLLFGSVARDEAGLDSDIDLLVEFDPPVGLFEVVRLRDYLESILERRVDLVLHDAVKPRLRERINAEAIVVLR